MQARSQRVPPKGLIALFDGWTISKLTIHNEMRVDEMHHNEPYWLRLSLILFELHLSGIRGRGPKVGSRQSTGPPRS